MGKLEKIKNFIFRLLIYFVVVLWPYTKLQNIYQDVEQFKNSILRNLALINIRFDQKAYDDLILITFFFYSCAELVFAILGLFNYFIGHIFSMIFFVITNFIYFNPFIEVNKIKIVNTKVELFYNIGVFFSIGLLAFYPQKEEKKKDEIEEPKKILEDDEMKRSMPVKKNKKK